MILVDVNLLLYAYNASASQHTEARKWLEETIVKTEPFGLSWITILVHCRRRLCPLSRASISEPSLTGLVSGIKDSIHTKPRATPRTSVCERLRARSLQFQSHDHLAIT
jgi:predicted nucleic acid-binding protein